MGSQLLWFHTYGERFIPEDQPRGHVPRGAAKCEKGVPGDLENYPDKFSYSDVKEILRVGEGEFAPVPPEVYEFEVSGLKVVQSWLKYRMKRGGGRKSSPLDDIRPERWDEPVHHGATRIALDIGGERRILFRTGAPTRSSHRKRLLPSRRIAESPR